MPQAYQRAGYSTRGEYWQKEAWKLANHPRVRVRVDELIGRIREAEVTNVGVSRGWILSKVVDNMTLAFQGMPARCESCGEDMGNYLKYDHRAINQAAELLGLDHGMFARRADIRFGKLDPLEGGNPEAFNERILALIQKLGIGPWILERLSVAVGCIDDGGSAAPRNLPATSEADGVSLPWDEVPGAMPDGWEPDGKDDGGSGGGGDARDGDLSPVVARPTLLSPGSRVGLGGDGQDDPGQRAEDADWSRR